MRLRMMAALAATAVSVVLFPAQAVDMSSLPAFVQSCKDDVKACRVVAINAVQSARNARYGCIPAELSNDDAGDKLWGWLKDTANADPKLQKEPLSDLMWTGIDEIWPCKK